MGLNHYYNRERKALKWRPGLGASFEKSEGRNSACTGKVIPANTLKNLEGRTLRGGQTYSLERKGKGQQPNCAIETLPL